MLLKNEWWKVISSYNENIFPLQWIGYFLIVILTIYIVFGNEEKANTLIKSSLIIMNGAIGILFFVFNTNFPLVLRLIQGFLFILISLLFMLDLKRKTIQFQYPKSRWKKIFFLIGGLFLFIYPFVGALQGKSFEYWFFQGTLPCPTTAYTLFLFITAKKRDNKFLFALLLIWAIPFPPLIQIPKYHVYEDVIMFFFGLVGLVIFINDLFLYRRAKGNINKLNLYQYKHIFNLANDSVFATESKSGILNIVPIHSKHLISNRKILITDQFMNKTKHNVLENPYAMLLIKDEDIIYKISGKCQYKSHGMHYLLAVRGTKKYAKKKAKNKNIKIACKGIILMYVRDVQIEKI